MHRAELVLLERTALAVPIRVRDAIQSRKEAGQLDGRDVEPVPVLLEPAASSRNDTDGPAHIDFVLHRLVKTLNRADDLRSTRGIQDGVFDLWISHYCDLRAFGLQTHLASPQYRRSFGGRCRIPPAGKPATN